MGAILHKTDTKKSNNGVRRVIEKFLNTTARRGAEGGRLPWRPAVAGNCTIDVARRSAACGSMCL